MYNLTASNDLPDHIPILALLGLRDDGDVEWGRVRALQFQGLRYFNKLKTVVMILCALFALQFMLQWVNPLIALGWAAMICGVYLWSHVRQQRLALWDRKQVSQSEAMSNAIFSTAGGLLWGMAFLYLGMQGHAEALILTWVTALCILAGAAALLSSLPLGSLAFIIISGLGAMAGFAWIESYHLVLLSAAITIVLAFSVITLARTFISGRIAKASLAEKNEVVRLLLREFEDAGADWLWQLDTSRRIVHVSSRFSHALGKDPDEINGRPFVELMAGDAWDSGKFPPALHDLTERLKKRESFSNMLVPVEIDGHRRWWELSASPKLDESGIFLGFRGVGSDVTEQRESAEKIAHMARYDTLTGLPNRLHLTESLGKAMENAAEWNGRWGIMMIDLDRFKAVNDTLGHLVGDRLLARVSERLRAIMTANELCGRLGGDEFAVVVRDASDADYVSELARRIIETLSRPYEIDQHTLYIGASVGTAVGPRDGRTVEMLMRSADLALYRSKDQGGNTHRVYEPQLHVQAEERRVMEIALRKALANEEMSLNFQPVVNSDTGGLTGFEALLRWTHPEFGPVSPAKFIPIAEDARLIVPIGAWVMQTACREAVKWPETVKVAVNVSADQLHEAGFVDMVAQSLRESGLTAQRLEIEVTESLFMQEGTRAIEILDEIIGMGINLSLDDFGTGYSSLGYLRKTRFSTIKVDRSFVQGAAKKVPESLAIIRAVVAMADSLGMSTTAEGAETADEVRMIQKLGCRKIQGYYFGRPMSASDAEALFRKSSLHFSGNMPKQLPGRAA